MVAPGAEPAQLAKTTTDDGGTEPAPDGSVSSCPVVSTVTVGAAYPLHGANWNDYVTVSDTAKARYAQPDVACAGTEHGYFACVHGGERRKVVVTGTTSCSGLTASDAIGAFDWTCDASSGTATFYSKGLKQGKGLRDLIAANGTAFEPNFVTVSKSGCGAIATSAAGTWWSNAVGVLPANSLATDPPQVLATAGKIYTLTASALSTGYNVNADRISVVTLPGATLGFSDNMATADCDLSTGEAGSGAWTSAAFCIGSQKFLWVEAKVDGLNGADKYTRGLLLYACDFCRVHGSDLVHVTNFPISVSASKSSLVSDSRTTTVGADVGISVGDASRYVTVQRSTSSGVGTNFYLTANSRDNVFSEIRADSGYLTLSDSDGNIVQDNVFTRVMRTDNQFSVLDGGSGTVFNTTVAGVTLRGTGSATKGWVPGMTYVNSVLLGDPASRGFYTLSVNAGQIIDAHVEGFDYNYYSSGASNWKYRGILRSGNAGASDSLIVGGAGNEMDNAGNYGPGLTLNVSTGFSTAAGSFAAVTGSALSINDTVLRGVFGTFSPGAPCPASVNASNAANVVTDASGHVFLAHAFELIGESSTGNHNGLCESGETCVFAPNFGAYQGEGDPLSQAACTFTGGNGVTSVKMYGYPTNGR